MRTLLIFITSTVLLFSCNKETQVNAKLKGTWSVQRKVTSWGNFSGSSPKTFEHPSWGTIEFDKNGVGLLTVPDQPVIINGYDSYIPGFTANVNYLPEEDAFLIKYNDNGQEEKVHMKWGWDKKSFTIFNREMYYGSNSSSYSETILTCKKQ